MTDQLPAPVPGTDPVDETVITIQPDNLAATASQDSNALDNSYNRTIRSLREQELVRIRIPDAIGPQFVSINGVKNWYHPGVHMVPKQIAELLEDSKRI